jgi:hypothetical protein
MGFAGISDHSVNAREANRAVAANGRGNFLKTTKAIENGVPVGIALRGDKMIECDYRLPFSGTFRT